MGITTYQETNGFNAYVEVYEDAMLRPEPTPQELEVYKRAADGK